MTRRVVAPLITTLGLAPAAAPAEAAPELAGQNAVVARDSAYMEVTLPREVCVDVLAAADFNKTFRLEGGGKFGGVMLHQLDVPEAQAASAVASRFDDSYFCAGCARPAKFIGIGLVNAIQKAQAGFFLPPGRYRLYAFGAGEVLRATVSFPELSGERTFEPDTPHAVNLQRLPQRTQSLADEIYPYGDAVVLKSRSVVLDAALLYYSAKAGYAYQLCRYVGAPTHALSFYPGCPAEPGQDVTPLLWPDATVNPGAAAMAATGAIALPAGTYGIGGSYTNAAVIDSAGAVALSVPIGPPASDGEQPPPASAPTAQVVEGPRMVEPIPAGSSSTPPSGSAAVPQTARLTLASRRLRVRRGRVVIALRCAGNAPCRGQLAIGAARRRIEVVAGGRATVRFALPRRTLRTLRARAATTLTVRLAAAGAATRTHRVRVSR